MWIPASNLNWQRNAECAKPENKNLVNNFFSDDISKKHEVKNLCYSCPVRDMCLQWALEHRQIWGVWGGKDEFEIRRTLSVSYTGEETKRRRSPKCPYCSARTSNLSVSTEKVPGGGRWTTAKIVTCSECNFSWRSRTSANAVNSYHQDKKDFFKKKSASADKTEDSSEV